MPYALKAPCVLTLQREMVILGLSMLSGTGCGAHDRETADKAPRIPVADSGAAGRVSGKPQGWVMNVNHEQ